MRLTEYRILHPDFVDDVRSHRTKRDALLTKIAAASGRDKRRWLIRSFLSNPEIKLLYLLESVQHKGVLAEFPPEQLRASAHELSAVRFVSEPVTPVNLARNSSSRRRTTYNFGPRRHALQRMVADVIKCLFPICSERHFTINGGVRKALQAVQEHARQGFICAVERDIVQFYPSVDFHGLARLLQPLPRSVVMNVLAYRPGYRPSEARHSNEAVDVAPLPLRGLLAQGSAASPAAAEVIMADLLREMPNDVRVMSYADNVLILGETLGSVNAASAFLEARASEHACGPLRLKAPNSSNITDPAGINFLGNQGNWSDDQINWEPNHHAIENIMRAIEEPRSLDEILTTIEWIRRWRRGYPLWSNGGTHTEYYIAQLASRMALSTTDTLSQHYQIGLRLVLQSCEVIRSQTGSIPDLIELVPDIVELDESGTRRIHFIAAINQRLARQNAP